MGLARLCLPTEVEEKIQTEEQLEEVIGITLEITDSEEDEEIDITLADHSLSAQVNTPNKLYFVVK